MAECILSGRKGDKGDTGARGATGATGATGPRGPAGPSTGAAGSSLIIMKAAVGTTTGTYTSKNTTGNVQVVTWPGFTATTVAILCSYSTGAGRYPGIEVVYDSNSNTTMKSCTIGGNYNSSNIYASADKDGVFVHYYKLNGNETIGSTVNFNYSFLYLATGS